MTISTLAGYRSSQRQTIQFDKTSPSAISIPTSSWLGSYQTFWDATGQPSAGTLSAGNTANGLVPDNTTTGAPSIVGFSGGTGYLTSITSICFASNETNQGSGRALLYDRLFHAGAYAFNANTTLASQPSYSARLPNTDYKGLKIFFEAVTSFTGNANITLTYTDQDGNPGHSTSWAPGVAPTIRQAWEIPLASGDYGIRKLESVVSATATAGTFNIVIARPLAWLAYRNGQQAALDEEIVLWLDRTGMPTVYATSCLALTFQSPTNQTSDFGISMDVEIASA